MAVKVKLKFVRHSARKLRPVLSVFVGKKLDSVIDRTSLMAQDAAAMLHKTLKMARSAAEEKQFNPDKLIITQLFATEGPRIKRSRANSRGRTNRYMKHLAHITAVVDEQLDKNTVTQAVIKPQKTKVETKVRSKKGAK